MPRFSKGIIWGNVSTGAKILGWVNKVHNFLLTNPGKKRYIAIKYKRMFFCEPTDKKIDEAFDLVSTDKISYLG